MACLRLVVVVGLLSLAAGRLGAFLARGRAAGLGLSVVVPTVPLVAGLSDDISVLPSFWGEAGAGFGGGGG